MTIPQRIILSLLINIMVNDKKEYWHWLSAYTCPWLKKSIGHCCIENFCKKWLHFVRTWKNADLRTVSGCCHEFFVWSNWTLALLWSIDAISESEKKWQRLVFIHSQDIENWNWVMKYYCFVFFLLVISLVIQVRE
jgi:hypothetical protein